VGFAPTTVNLGGLKKSRQTSEIINGTSWNKNVQLTIAWCSLRNREGAFVLQQDFQEIALKNYFLCPVRLRAALLSAEWFDNRWQ